MRWDPYVPVEQRIAQAEKQMQKLAKKGLHVQPITISGRNIAKKFWGIGWCEHLENHSDFSNRLPRGRRYVNNGSVVHLEIQEGYIKAYVAGSNTYEVKVTISTLPKDKWGKIKERCQGKVDSLLELLTGKLSDKVMEVVANHHDGLFPQNQEMKMRCSCPDWAGMCKHVAAVLYGVGNRLDTQPELLFLLRGVNPNELIDSKLDLEATSSSDVIEDSELSALFDIELEGEEVVAKENPKKKGPRRRKLIPEKMTGNQLKNFRKKRKMSVATLARALDVTPASVYRWEKSSKTLCLRQKSKDAILNLQDT